ncbi:MAG: hypothetical protein ISS93_02075 [Candidatus Aenigmarchaeota archaeon]|nr:hypothetical protein [Candidatus Aenigmarchaeota archaeon]
MKAKHAEWILYASIVILLLICGWSVFGEVIPAHRYGTDERNLWAKICKELQLDPNSNSQSYMDYQKNIFPEVHEGKINSEAVSEFAEDWVLVPGGSNAEEVHKEATKKVIQIIQSWIKENRPQSSKSDDDETKTQNTGR